MRLPYPNRVQWGIIWTAALLSAHVWLRLDFGDFLPDRYGGWGLSAYLAGALKYRYGVDSHSRIALAILFLAALLIWQTSRPKEKKESGQLTREQIIEDMKRGRPISAHPRDPGPSN